MQKQPTVHLLVVERGEGPMYYAKWRDPARGGTQIKRKVGRAWIERGESSTGGKRRTRHEGWIKRRGRAPEGFFSESTAQSEFPSLVGRYDGEQARERAKKAASAQDVVTFDTLADAWLNHVVTMGGIKRTTRSDYESMLRHPDDKPKKRGRAPVARIMSEFGGRAAVSITRLEIVRWLSKLDADPALSPRSVNKYRQVVLSIYTHACQPDTFGLTHNPVEGTQKRREADAAEIVTYTPADVEAIARAASLGSHRALGGFNVTEDEAGWRTSEDAQDACLIIVAAFCGLRMGECLALRWRHVLWDAQRLHIQRSYALGEEDSTKSRRGRTVPLADQPAQRLARLSQRSMFVRQTDLVFCSRTGEHLDGSALRRRYKAARGSAIAANPDMLALRFHDLRHTFGTLAAQGFDLVNVQAMMGHSDSRTTSRYLHARPAAEDAARLSRIFDADMAAPSSTPPRSLVGGVARPSPARPSAGTFDGDQA